MNKSNVSDEIQQTIEFKVGEYELKYRESLTLQILSSTGELQLKLQ